MSWSRPVYCFGWEESSALLGEKQADDKAARPATVSAWVNCRGVVGGEQDFALNTAVPRPIQLYLCRGSSFSF